MSILRPGDWDKTETGPVSVDPVMVKHPVEFKDGYPVDRQPLQHGDGIPHQAPSSRTAKRLTIRHDKDNGILFEGTEGRIFVNRGRLTGQPVEDLTSNPLPEGALEQVYKRSSADRSLPQLLRSRPASQRTHLRRLQPPSRLIDLPSGRYRGTLKPKNRVGPPGRKNHRRRASRQLRIASTQKGIRD